MSFSDLNDWDPMKEAYMNKSFNSYRMQGHVLTHSKHHQKPSLYVRYVPSALTEEALYNLFSKFGNVTKVVLKFSSSDNYKYGYINFNTVQEAESTLARIDKKLLHGMTVELSRAGQKDHIAENSDSEVHFTDIPPPTAPTMKAVSNEPNDIVVPDAVHAAIEQPLGNKFHPGDSKGANITINFHDGKRSVGLLPTPPQNQRLLTFQEGDPYDDCESSTCDGYRDECYDDGYEDGYYNKYYGPEDCYLPPHNYNHRHNPYRYPPHMNLHRGYVQPYYSPHAEPCCAGECMPYHSYNCCNDGHGHQHGHLPQRCRCHSLHHAPPSPHIQNDVPSHVPDLKPNVVLCSHCKNKSSFACSFCDEPYCSNECIIAAWPTHQKVCLNRRKTKPSPQDDVQLKENCVKASADGYTSRSSCNGDVLNQATTSKVEDVPFRSKITSMNCNENQRKTHTNNKSRTNDGRRGAVANDSNERDSHSTIRSNKFSSSKQEHFQNRHVNSESSRTTKHFSNSRTDYSGGTFSKASSQTSRKKTLDLDEKIFAKESAHEDTSNDVAETRWDDDSVGIRGRTSLPSKSVSPQKPKEKPLVSSSNSVPKEVIEMKKTSLSAKDNEMIQVCFVENPGKFWVQRVDDCNSLTEILTDCAALSSNKVQFQEPSVGDICAAPFEDGCLYRAEVTQLKPSDKCEVFYMDFGNAGEVNKADICCLPSKLATHPSMAICCSLADIKPSNGSVAWKNEDTDFFKHCTQEKFLKTCVVQSANSVYTVDLLTEEGLSISSLLVSSKYAEWTTEKVSGGETVTEIATEDSVAEGVPHILCSLQVGSKVPVSPILCENNVLYALVGDIDTFAAMESEIQELNSRDVTMTIENGDIALAYSPFYERWYRSFIKERKKGTVLVRYIDYGNEEEVKQLTELPLKYLTVSSPLMCLKTSDSSLEILQKLSGSKFEATIVSIQNNCAEITVMCESSKLTLQGFPWFHGLHLYLDMNAELNSAKGPKITGTFEASEKKSTSVQKSGSPPPPSPQQTLVRAVLAKRPLLSGRNQILVVCVKSPQKIYIQRAIDIEEIAQMSNDINLYCNSHSEPYMPQENEIVCARYSPDNCWYRSLVRNILPENKFRVAFIDYGNDEIVTLNEIRPLDKKFTCPRFSILVALSGVSANTSLESVEKLMDKFFEMEVVNDDTVPKSVILFENGNQLFSSPKAKTPPKAKSPPKVQQANIQHVAVQVLKRSSLSPQVIAQFDNCDIRIIHFDVAKQFHVRRLLDEDAYKLQQKKLREICSSEESAPFIPAVDDLVFAFFKGEWHRGYVCNVMAQTCLINLIDMGNKEKIGCANLKPLTKEFLNSAYSIAMVLDDVPENLLTDIKCENLKSLFYKLKIVHSDCYPIKGKLYLENICINDSMKEVTIERCFSPYNSRPRNVLLSSLPKQTLPVNVAVNVIFWCNKDDHYFLQKASDLEEVSEMSNRLQLYCESAKVATCPFSIGEIFCAKSASDGTWYRACIESIPSPDNCKVLFIDYGNSEMVNRENMRTLSNDFAKHPVYCICVTVPSSETAVHPIEFEKVVVIEATGDQDCLSVRIMTEELPSSSATCSLPSENVPSSDIQQHPSVSPAKPNIPSDIFELDDCVYVDFPVGKMQVVIYSAASWDAVFAAPCVEENVVANDALVNELTAYCEKLQCSKYSPTKVHELVIAKFPDDGRWYRAAVVILEPNHHCVCFVDYGDTAYLDDSCLRKMQPKFMALPIQSHFCILGGLKVDENNVERINNEIPQLLPLSCIKEAIVSKNEQGYVLDIPEVTQYLHQKKIIV